MILVGRNKMQVNLGLILFGSGSVVLKIEYLHCSNDDAATVEARLESRGQQPACAKRGAHQSNFLGPPISEQSTSDMHNE